MEKALSFVLFLALFSVQGSSTTITGHDGGFSVPLIHRDTIHQHRHSASDLVITTDDVRGQLVPSFWGTIFFLNVSIGETPLPQLLVMDTGSDVRWVQCPPCKGCHEDASPSSLYDPLKSSSYSSISCSSDPCNQLNSNRNDCSREDGKCKFQGRYLDGSSSFGTAGYEKFTFMTSDDGLIEVQNVLFGCGEEVDLKIKDRRYRGLFGLGSSKNSIFSATGYKKFSYCTGDSSDKSYQYNKLIIGDGAIIQGDSTPMWFDSMNRYYVRLEGISIGETQIQGMVTMAIDSGTSLSYIPKAMMDPLKAEVRRLMDGALDEKTNTELMCFEGDMHDLINFPTINLWFDGGVNLELDVEAAFFAVAYKDFRFGYASHVCLTFLEAKGRNPYILGAIAQQKCNVGFNLEDMSVSFQRIDCELLEG